MRGGNKIRTTRRQPGGGGTAEQSVRKQVQRLKATVVAHAGEREAERLKQTHRMSNAGECACRQARVLGKCGSKGALCMSWQGGRIRGPQGFERQARWRAHASPHTSQPQARSAMSLIVSDLGRSMGRPRALEGRALGEGARGQRAWGLLAWELTAPGGARAPQSP